MATRTMKKQKQVYGNQQKGNFARTAQSFFEHFFAVVQHSYNVKLSEASWLHILWRKCRTCSCSLFSHCCSFPPSRLPAFLILSLPLQNFLLFLQQTMSPLFFLSCSSAFFSLSFAGVSPYFVFFSFSFSIFQICGHDN